MSDFADFLLVCIEGNIRAAYRLKAKGQDLNEADAQNTGLMMASFNNQLNIVKYLVRRGAIVNTANNRGVTALIYASCEGNLDVPRFLCDSGADVNAADNDGYTALMAACGEGHLDVSRFLCDSGADVNAEMMMDPQLSCSLVIKVSSRSSSTSPSKEPICLQDFKTDAQPSRTTSHPGQLCLKCCSRRT